jgi:Zn-dependent M28 family amino/carboxypeptidase
VTVVGLGKSELDRFLETALKPDGRSITSDPKPEAGYYYRSDHFALAKRGVPMIYMEGGEDLLNGGREAGARLAADYTENRYHGHKDEFNEAWDWSGVMADLQLYYRLGRMMAMSTSWPNWNEGDEFRAIRDESCKADAKGC